jgi:hypothetical protein
MQTNPESKNEILIAFSPTTPKNPAEMLIIKSKIESLEMNNSIFTQHILTQKTEIKN